MTTFAIGDEVHVKPEYEDGWPAKCLVPFSTFVVKSVPNGRTRNYGLRHKEVTAAPGIKAEDRHLAAGAHPGISLVAIAPVLHNGTVVEFKDGAREGLWVVTGFTAKGHQVYPLGGSDRGLRNVSGLRLEVVTLDLGDDDKNDTENWGEGA